MPRILKRILIGLGVILGLFVLAAVLIPVFVNVDDYRPKIVEIANQKINGKVQLEKLTLSLWGKIKVRADGFSLSDSVGRPVVSAKDVDFQLPILSILTGSPTVRINLTRPKVAVAKDKAGKINLLSLMKTDSATSPAVPPATPAPGGPATELPGIVTRASLSLEMRDAHLRYLDEGTGFQSTVEDLNLRVRDMSLSRPMQFEMWAQLNTQMGKAFHVAGPARAKGQASPEVKDGVFSRASLELDGDLNGVEIDLPGLFHKGKEIVAGAHAKMVVSPESVSDLDALFRFNNAEIRVTGGVSSMTTTPAFNIDVKSNEVSLKSWNALVPLLKAYDLSGNVSFRAQLNGTAATPSYQADLSAKDVSAKAPMIKAPPHINGHVKVKTDQIESMQMTMSAPGNDLRVVGSVQSFAKPKVDIQVTSKGMDLDQLIDFPKPEPKKTNAPQTAVSSGGPVAPGKGEPDFDKLLDPARSNPIARDTSLTFKANLSSIKAYGVRMTDILGQCNMKTLDINCTGFRVGVFGGVIKMGGAAQLLPKIPTYKFTTEVNGLDLKQAVTSQLELFKNTVMGTAFFKIDGNGSSFNPRMAKARLGAKGNFRVERATFAAIDVARMASEAIGKTLESLSSKVPALKGKKVEAPADAESKYDFIGADFTIGSGVFRMPNFNAKAQANKGLDLKGNTVIGLIDQSVNADWEVIDTYNMTKARDLSVDQGGVHVDHVLAEGNGPVKFPVHVGGSLFAPQPSYTSVPEHLTKVALNNVGRAAGEKAKAEVRKKVDEQLKQIAPQAPPQVQEAIQDLGKKLFGN